MAGFASIEADQVAGPGHALIRIGGGAMGIADPRFAITRPGYENAALGPGGWQVAETLLTAVSARVEGDDLVLAIGPPVVNRVEAGAVVLAVPSAGYDEAVYWPDLPLAPDLGGHGAIAAALPAPDIAAQSPVPPPPPPPRPVAPSRVSPQRRPSSILFLMLGLLLLAIIGGGGWWALNRRPPAPVEAAQVAPPVAPHPAPAPASPAPAQPSPAAASAPPPRATADCAAKSAVKDIVGCAATPDALLDIAVRRWDQHETDQGFLLMQIAADRGSGKAALRLAQLYDPDTFRPGGPISAADARQAAKYYREAVQHGQQAAITPRQALRRRLEQDRDSGQTLAGLTLKDFWP